FRGFAGSGARVARRAFGGARFSGRSFGTINRTSRIYSGGGERPAVGSRGFTALGNPSAPSRTTGTATIGRQQNRAESLATQNSRVSNSQTSRAAGHRAMANNQVAARHDANWHRDWNKHRAHFHNNLVFVLVDGFWWGLPTWYYQWGYYPYYVYYPYDYYGYPYDYYGYDSSNNDDQSASVDSDQDGNNATVSTVQSELAKLGYYNGAIDGDVGYETEAALARDQEN